MGPHRPHLLQRGRRRRARRPERLVEDVRRPALEVLLEAQLARERVPLRREAVLVAQRGLGAPLMIDVARVAVREIRERERGVERVVQDAVRLPLAALAVQRVDRELVVLARLVRRVAGDGVDERDLRARSVLLQVRERRRRKLFWRKIGVVARAVVAHERVAAVGREADRAASRRSTPSVDVAGRAGAERDAAARAGVGLLPQHDVDDARDARRRRRAPTDWG